MQVYDTDKLNIVHECRMAMGDDLSEPSQDKLQGHLVRSACFFFTELN